jgi:hypothetical protein
MRGSSEAAAVHKASGETKSIILLGSAAVALLLPARAQQPERVRRIGVLMTIDADDPEAQVRLATFRARLEQLGWADGANVQIDTRSAGAILTASGNLRRNWSRSPQTSSWPIPAQPSHRYCS